MEDISRVFFHELGHFIAHEINYRFYNGNGVQSFIIEPSKVYPHLFDGEVKTILENGRISTDPPPESSIHESLAACKYGCIFQSYFMDTDLPDCLTEHGKIDNYAWYANLAAGKLAGYDIDIQDAEEAYFKELKKEGLLDDIMKLDPLKYLNHIGGNRYIANMDELRKDTNDFITKHKLKYQTLLDEYHKIIPL